MDSNTLAPHLLQNGLLTADDLERLQLSLVTRSDKVNFLLCKLLHLEKERFEVFMNCLLKANDHSGHEELYKKLST